jgi:hypothetical protein
LFEVGFAWSVNRHTREPSAWIRREISATALLAQPRPRWAGGVYTGPTRATPNEGGLTPVRCTRSPAWLTQNHSHPARSRRSISTRSGASCALAPRGRPACSSAFAHERAEPLHNQFHVVLGRGLQAAGHSRGPHQLAEFVQPRVLADLNPAPAEPGQLGCAQVNGRKGAVEAEHLLPALVQRAGQGHGRLGWHRQQEWRVGRKRRGAHPGTGHGRCVPDHQPPVAAGLRDPVSLLRQQPVRDGGYDRADHRVGGQVVTSYGKELARIGAGLQPQSGNRESAHLRTLATGVPRRHRNIRAAWICERRARGDPGARKANRCTALTPDLARGVLSCV